MRLRSFTTFAVAAAATFIAGCAGDSPVAPKSDIAPPPAAADNLLGTLLGTPTAVTPLKRSVPLASSVSTSKTIGILGGVLTLPSTGLTVIVPPLAVVKSTKFTITALAGSAVAYDFEPHGTRFTVPLIATQSLKGTQAQNGGLINPLSLFAGYFPDASHVTSVTELLNLNVDLLGQVSVLTIWHFSGYMWASGRAADADY